MTNNNSKVLIMLESILHNKFKVNAYYSYESIVCFHIEREDLHDKNPIIRTIFEKAFNKLKQEEQYKDLIMDNKTVIEIEYFDSDLQKAIFHFGFYDNTYHFGVGVRCFNK